MIKRNYFSWILLLTFFFTGKSLSAQEPSVLKKTPEWKISLDKKEV